MATMHQRTNAYETTIVLHPDLNEDGEKKIIEKVEEIIKQFGGNVKKHESWGKKRLAYEIAKQNKGHYLYWHYDAFPGVIHELERNLRLNDKVLRFLTIKLTAKDLNKLAMMTQVEDSKKVISTDDSNGN